MALLAFPSGWYDGEIVINNTQGLPDFGALQMAFETNQTQQLVLYLFDVVYFDG
ncbi:MAG: hypothetical protein H7Z18_12230 [Methylophilaceae bacterium]|nr:hypothetical protein [Methylophilaceae bacterium]